MTPSENTPEFVTTPYGRNYAVGTVVRASGGWVSDALDLAKLTNAFAGWTNTGVVNVQGVTLLSPDAVAEIFKFVTAIVEDPNEQEHPAEPATTTDFTETGLGWRRLATGATIPGLAPAMYTGGGMEGGASVAKLVPGVAGSPAVSVLFSRRVPASGLHRKLGSMLVDIFG